MIKLLKKEDYRDIISGKYLLYISLNMLRELVTGCHKMDQPKCNNKETKEIYSSNQKTFYNNKSKTNLKITNHC